MCMSEAEFWWNHLTYPQRLFITQTDIFNQLDHPGEMESTMKEFTNRLYENRDHFISLPGWPETPMRSI